MYYVEYPSKKIKGQKNERVNGLAICKIKARAMINAPEVAYQEDDVTYNPIISTDEGLSLQSDVCEEIFIN